MAQQEGNEINIEFGGAFAPKFADTTQTPPGAQGEPVPRGGAG